MNELCAPLPHESFRVYGNENSIVSERKDELKKLTETNRDAKRRKNHMNYNKVHAKKKKERQRANAQRSNESEKETNGKRKETKDNKVDRHT